MASTLPDPTRRNERSRRAILDAAIALIAELSYDRVSIEAIAKRAGVGKQTIYRWWPSKGAVALEALDDSLATVVDFADSGDIAEDLRTHMTNVTQLLASTQISPVIQGLIAAAQCDPALSRAHLDKVIEPANVAWFERIASAQDSGELRADADPQAVIDMLFGAMYYRLLLHTRPPEPEQIDAALDIAFEGLRSTRGRRAHDAVNGADRQPDDLSAADASHKLNIEAISETSASKPDPSRRNERSRLAILAAAVALISELGYDRVSIEAIAKHAGVGKQTIYRWWPSKGAVVLEALNDSLATVVDFPDSGDIVEDLRTQMKGVTQLLGSTDVGPVYQGLIAAAQSDPALSRAHLEQVIAPANVACHARLARAQDHGEMRADADRQTMIDMLYGAIYFRLLLHTRPLAPEPIDAALDIAFKGLR